MRTSGLIVLMLMAGGAAGLHVSAPSPVWAQAAATPFDDAEAQLRLRQASTAASAAAREVDGLRKELEVERRRVVQTESERELNQAVLKGLEKDLKAAEARQRETDAALKAAQDERARGLAAAGRQPEAAPPPAAPPQTATVPPPPATPPPTSGPLLGAGPLQESGLTRPVGQEAYDKASKQCFEGRGDEMLEGCDIVIQANRESPRRLASALLMRGLGLSSKGQADRAIEDYERAMKLRPDDFLLFYARGLAYARKGFYDLAIQDQDEAIRLQPDYAASFANRASAYLNLGRYDRALQDHDKAVQLDPDNGGRWNGRCWAKALAGRPREALPDCDHSLKLRPGDSNTLDSRALVLLQLGRIAEAYADSRAAVDKSPKSPGRRYLLSLILAAKGDAAASRTEMETARQLASPVEFERIQRELARFRRN